MSLIQDFKWRYATKFFDNTRTVETELVENIIEATRLAPTSSGLQPFELIVITNQALKEQIVPISFGQAMSAQCSHLLVFAVWDSYTDERINHIFDITTRERNLPLDKYAAYQERLKTIFGSRTEEQNFAHAAHQAYIALGFAMAEAAVLKVDSVPMEGFNTLELDELLNLKEKGLKSVLMLPLGYRDEQNDWLAPMEKVRHPKSEFVSYLD